MSEVSKIDWTDTTWNPVRGCTKVSPGCKFCYAQRFAERFRGVAGHPYELGFDLRLVPQKLREPLKWKEPRRIFVNSMSDLFHENIETEFIERVFETMHTASWHTFQILTKRSHRLAELGQKLEWPDNVWMGVSVENEGYTYRIDDLVRVPAKVRFLSIEPLLGPIPNLNLDSIDWVIVGGESGDKARPMDLQWVRTIRDLCKASGTAFFLKQLGGRRGKRAGQDAILDGRLWRDYPNQSAGKGVEIAA